MRDKPSSSKPGIDSKPLKPLLIFLLIITPFIGATEYIWPQSIIIFLGSIFVFIFTFTLFKSKNIEFLNTLLIPLLFIFFAIILFTLVPLPKGLLKVVSPNTYSLYKDYLPGYADGSFFSTLKPLTLDPYRTLISVSMLFTYAIVFFCLINKFDTSRSRTRVAQLIIIMSTIIASWGLLDIFSANEKLFRIKEVISGDPTGPFINTIHFAHFMALCIPLSLGMWLARIGSEIEEIRFSIVKGFIRNCVKVIKYSIFYLLPAMIMTFALFKSLSRGAILSFFISIIVFMFLQLVKRNTRRKAFLLLSIIIFSLIIVFSLDKGEVKSRIETLKTPMKTDSAQTRTTAWKDTFQMFKDFPLFGTGLNSYQIIFPKYKSIFGSGKMFFTHAENDYIEMLAEIGIVGSICIILALIIFLRNVFYNFKREEDALKVTLLASGISSFAAISFSALTDFVFHIPAISLVFIFICFIIWPRAKGSKFITLDFENNKKKYMAAASICIGFCAFVIIFSIRLFLGQVFFYNFVHSPNYFEAKKHWIQNAAAFDKKNSFYTYSLGRLCYDQAGTIEQSNKDLSLQYLIEAKNNFQRAIELEPVNWRYHFYNGLSELVLAYSKDGYSLTQALNSLEKALELNPTEYDLYEYLGNYYLTTKPEKAFAYYRQLLILRPWKLSTVLNNIWKVYRNPNFLRQAIPPDPKLTSEYEKFLKAKGIK